MRGERLEHRACFGGWQDVWRHHSDVLHCDMKVGIYLPPQAAERPCPALYWLSGLTCTEQNFITKAGAQRYAAEHGLVLVVPDTSPRGPDVPDAEGYDLGHGASFYLDATEAPWSRHYRMESYLTKELPAWIADAPVTDVRGVFGHSMGGHGALTLALRNPAIFRSASAFSPIVSPTRVPWGRKAFAAYLGAEGEAWGRHDAVELARRGAAPELDLLVDQGEADEFLVNQLRPELLEAACVEAGRDLTLRRHAGYDHSYYFIASFVGDHVAWHAERLRSS